MDKSTNVQSNKNTNVTIQSELALYQRTGNSTHARTIADRLALALELGNIDAGFLLGLDTRLQLVPSTGGNVSAPFTDKGKSVAHSVSQAIEFLNMVPLHLDGAQHGSSHALHYVSMAQSHLGSIDL